MFNFLKKKTTIEHGLNGISQGQYDELSKKQEYTPPELIKCGHKSEDYEQSHDAFLMGDKYVSPNRGHNRSRVDEFTGKSDGLPLQSDSMNRHQKCKICGTKLVFKIDAFNQDLIK